MPVINYPTFIKEWDYEKNTSFSPEILTAGSSYKVWWKCSVCNHSWMAAPNERILHGNCCPECSVHKVNAMRLLRKGSFEENYPERAKDWDYKKNKDLLPSQVTAGSNKKVYWKCHVCGYKWKGMVCNHAKSMYSCEKCAIRERALERYGSRPLIETHPRLAEEWDYNHNGKLTPYNTTAHYSKSIRWICKRGHQWKQSVSVRVKQDVGCPHCYKESATSFAEQTLFFYLRQITPAQNRYPYNGIEIDIYLKDKDNNEIGIEYDGLYYHSKKGSKKREQKKDNKLSEYGVRVIRVKEDTRDEVIGDIIYVKIKKDYSHLKYAIENIILMTGLSGEIDFNIDRDKIKIYEQYIETEKENSIVAKMPEVAKQWDYEKNGNIKPENILCTSAKKFYWKCKKGHSWSAAVNSRYSGRGCPYCAGHILVVGENDLLSQNPEIAKQWDYEANGDLRPDQITVNNTKKVGWICPTCHHKWVTSVVSRNKNGGCPKCADKVRTATKYKNIIKKKGSFADNYPHLLQDWDFDMNKEIDPYLIPPNSGKVVNWKCHTCGHKWAVSICSRAKGRGCKECYKRENSKMQQQRAVMKKGAFAVTHPHLLQDWNYDNNIGTPEDYSAGSRYRANWRCHHCGYEWASSIFKRTGGHKCPKCHK